MWFCTMEDEDIVNNVFYILLKVNTDNYLFLFFTKILQIKKVDFSLTFR